MVQLGININPRAGSGKPDNLQDLAQLSWVRFVYIISTVHNAHQPMEQKLNEAFQIYDPIVDQLSGLGVSSLIILNQETFWGNGPWHDANGDWQSYGNDFANFARQIVARYKGKQVAYQVWNEGDIKGHSSIYVEPTNYAKLLRPLSKMIREVDASSIIVTGGLASGAGDAVQYVTQVEQAISGRLPVDVIAIHPYGKLPQGMSGLWSIDNGSLGDYINNLRPLIDRYRRFWVTEIGAADDGAMPGSVYRDIAQYLRAIYQEVKASYGDFVEAFIWFAWSDEMRNAGIVTANKTQKQHIYETFFSLASEQTSIALPPTRPTAIPITTLTKRQADVLVFTIANVAEPPTLYETLPAIETEDLGMRKLAFGEEFVAIEPISIVLNKMGQSSAWLTVITQNNERGFVKSNLVAYRGMQVTTEEIIGLNLRSAPSSTANRIGGIGRGDVVLALEQPDVVLQKLGKVGEWLLVETYDQREGWATAEFLVLISGLVQSNESVIETLPSTTPSSYTAPSETSIVIGSTQSGFGSPVGIDETWMSTNDWPGQWFDATGFAEGTTKAYDIASWGLHTGVDLNLNRPNWNADKDKPVFSIGDGIVTASRHFGSNSSWGNVVVIRHDPLPSGLVVYSRYAHLNVRNVNRGERVGRGTILGNIGAHLRNGRPVQYMEHLHFDISHSGVLATRPGHWPNSRNAADIHRDYMNPAEFLKQYRLN